MHRSDLGQELSEIVAAFDVDVRPDRSDQLCRRVFIEQDRDIDDVQRTDEREPVRFPIDGTGRSLEPPRAGIRVETDYQNIAERTSAAQKLDMTGMKDVKHAVSEDDALAEKALSFELGDNILERKDVRVVVQADPAQKILV